MDGHNKSLWRYRNLGKVSQMEEEKRKNEKILNITVLVENS